MNTRRKLPVAYPVTLTPEMIDAAAVVLSKYEVFGVNLGPTTTECMVSELWDALRAAAPKDSSETRVAA